MVSGSEMTVLILVSGACEPPPKPTIQISCTSKEIIADGRKISCQAKVVPETVAIEWHLTGSGKLTTPTGPDTQYIAPLELKEPEQIEINAKATNTQTGDKVDGEGCSIQLLPPLPPPPPPPTGTFTILITNPTDGGKASCPVAVPELCRFTVQGNVSGDFKGLLVRVWIQPVNPPGDIPGAWYLQANLIEPDSSGNWQAEFQIGNSQYPAHAGDTLKAFAWLVTREESDKMNSSLNKPIPVLWISQLI